MSIQQLSGTNGLVQPAVVARITQGSDPVSEQAPVQQPTSQAAPLSAEASKAPEPTSDQIKQAMQEIQHALAPVAQNLQFSVDNDSGKTVVKVVDAATKEVIRQIPSEELMSITRALNKLQGVLLSQKA